MFRKISDPMVELVNESIEDEMLEDEFYQQQQSEIAAENAWLFHAENQPVEPDWSWEA